MSTFRHFMRSRDGASYAQSVTAGNCQGHGRSLTFWLRRCESSHNFALLSGPSASMNHYPSWWCSVNRGRWLAALIVLKWPRVGLMT